MKEGEMKIVQHKKVQQEKMQIEMQIIYKKITFL